MGDFGAAGGGRRGGSAKHPVLCCPLTAENGILRSAHSGFLELSWLHRELPY